LLAAERRPVGRSGARGLLARGRDRRGRCRAGLGGLALVLLHLGPAADGHVVERAPGSAEPQPDVVRVLGLEEAAVQRDEREGSARLARDEHPLVEDDVHRRSLRAREGSRALGELVRGHLDRLLGGDGGRFEETRDLVGLRGAGLGGRRRGGGERLGAVERGERPSREHGANEGHVVALDREGQGVLGLLGSLFDHEPRDVAGLPHHHELEGGGLVERVRGVDVGASIEEEPDDVEVPLVAGEEERRRPIPAARVHGHAGVEQAIDGREVAVAGRVEEGLFTGARCLRGERRAPEERGNGQRGKEHIP
jgi:hypothetical protein